MKVRLPKKTNPGYEDQLKQADSHDYDVFFESCKAMKRSKDPIEAEKGRTLIKSYQLFRERGVPFAVAREIYPQLCRLMNDYATKTANMMKHQGKQ